MKRVCFYTTKCLKNARVSLDLNDNRKSLEWIERGIKSNVYHSDFNYNVCVCIDYFDELSSLKTQISDCHTSVERSLLKEKTEIKLKMVEEIDQFLIKYLQSNVGKAFTSESIMKRLGDELDNQEWLEYLEKKIEMELKKLTINGAIKSNQHEGRLFFFS